MKLNSRCLAVLLPLVCGMSLTAFPEEECECNDGSAQWVNPEQILNHQCDFTEPGSQNCGVTRHGVCRNDKVYGPGWNCVDTGDPNDDCEITRVNSSLVERSITGCSTASCEVDDGVCVTSCNLSCESTPTSVSIEVACND